MKVVIVEDDFAIRQGLKSLLKEISKKSKKEIEIFTTSNGVEGLGYIYTINPDLIIIDTTLPKYSGREVLEYLHTNKRFDVKKILVLHEKETYSVDLPEGYEIISKKDNQFSDHLKNSVQQHLGIVDEIQLGMKGNVINWINAFGNKSDYLMHTMPTKNPISKFFGYIKWLYYQLLVSINLTTLYLLGGKVKDSNIVQTNEDSKLFRVRAYPTLASLLVATIFLALQLGLFLSGTAIVLSKYRIENIAATLDKSVELNLSNSIYDESKVQVVNGVLQLKPIETVIQESGEESEEPENEEPGNPNMPNIEEPQLPEESPVIEEPTEEPVVDEPEVETPQNETPEETPPAETPEGEESTNQDEVLGASDEQEVVVSYSGDKPSIEFFTEVRYTELISLEEESSLNTKDSSELDLNQTIEELRTRSFEANEITYQLSPNKIDWYYYGGEAVWEKTTQGFASSNTVQEVNKYLSKYTPQVASEEKTVYIKAFLHSDGKTQVTLNKLTVNRDLNIITELEESEEVVQEAGDGSQESVEEPVSLVEPDSFPSSYPTSFNEDIENTEVSSDLVENIRTSNVVILNASFANGNKVISGYVEFSDSKVIEENLENIKVKIYYSDNRDYSKDANDKNDLIGESELIKIRRNNRDQFVWELIQPSTDGGYVVGELVYEKEEVKIESKLSNPVENSTFTVNEGGDQSDASAGNGSCDRDAGTPGSQCTLRAAIEESNALAGSDNIFFSIPTTDASYRDYDNENVATSGDGVGGDDYWRILPAAGFYGQVTGALNIDGSTQTTNQGNRNTYGPEIQLDGLNVGGTSVGIWFYGSSTANTLNALNIRNFQAAVQVEAEIVTLTNNYINVDAKGLDNNDGTLAIGVNTINSLSNDVDTLVIGTSGNGNVISAESGAAAIRVFSDTTQNPNFINVTIQANKIGLTADGTAKINIQDAIGLGEKVNALIGGNTSAERNYISGYQGTGIAVGVDNGALVEIYNNFFDTDVNGNLDLSNGSSRTAVDVLTSTTLSAPGSVNIGAQGKGNFIRFENGNRAIRISAENDATINVDSNTIFADIAIVNSSNPNTNILRNFISYKSSDPDPYFGKSTFNNGDVSPLYALFLIASTAVKGNHIEGYNNGIATDYIFGEITVGGQSALTNSLCEGLEKNCFVNNTHTSSGEYIAANIMFAMGIPMNYETIYEDNSFSYDIGVTEYPAFVLQFDASLELMSGSRRRTDLADSTVVFPLAHADAVFDSWNYTNFATSLENTKVACLDSLDCPASLGEDGMTVLFTNPDALGSVDASYSGVYLSGIVITADGMQYAPFYNDYEGGHLTMEKFSFDGLLTDIQTQDNGEKQTMFPSATGNPNTFVTYPFNPTREWQDLRWYEIAEIHYVDANPIFNGTKWIITVDSTTTEDNVSDEGFDDGDGAYSGGGVFGPDGLPDGNTSLIEAEFVVDNFTEETEIVLGYPDLLDEFVMELTAGINDQEFTDATPILDFTHYGKDGYRDILAAQYKVYLDGVLVDTIDAVNEDTQYQVASALTAGSSHSWYVEIYEDDGTTLIATTDTETFKIAATPEEPEEEPGSEEEEETPENNNDEEDEEETSDPVTLGEVGPSGVTTGGNPTFSWEVEENEEDLDLTYQIIIYDSEGNKVFDIDRLDGNKYLYDGEPLQNGDYTWVLIVKDNGVEIERDQNSFKVDRQLDVAVDDTLDEDESSILDSDTISVTVNTLPPVIAVIAALLSLFGFLSLGTGTNIFGMAGILFGWIYRRNKKAWGIVYDPSESKVIPFATLRLYKIENGISKFVGQSITDLKGQYGFLVDEEGQFLLEVSATGFDKVKSKVTIGEDLEVLRDIQLHKSYQKTGVIKSLINQISYNKLEILSFVNRAFLALMIIGFGVTLVATIKDSSLTNFSFLGIYTVLFILNLYFFIKDRRNSLKATVLDAADNKPLDNVSIRIYDKKRQVLITLTNKLGKIKANLPEGKYKAIVAKDGYSVDADDKPNDFNKGIYETLNPFGDNEGKSLAELIDKSFINININKKGYFDKQIKLHRI
jgi:CheY-like chemotaxis protein